MFVPLDLLYDYLEDIVKQDLVIYRFWPHGSKNIQDLVPKHDYTMFDSVTRPIVIFHDQEPLNYALYQSHCLQHTTWFNNWPSEFRQWWLNRNLRSACEVNIHDRCIVTHSEHNSDQVSLYTQNGFETVYVWSHALLARDWFRYAMLDPKLHQDQIVKHEFNIYARAWTGSREYRLYFLSLIQDIAHRCRTTFSTVDEQHYSDYKFNNPRFDIMGTDLENYFGNTTITSNSSATYDADHYAHTMFDVVLETVFDESRIHLTEKTLRPIACGQPFILVAPPGSLEYLKGYGFKTFSSLIDESYDKESNAVRRLQLVATEMRRIARLPASEKRTLASALKSITDYNKLHFFSHDFFTQVINEYMINMQQALSNLADSRCGTEWYQHIKLYDNSPDYKSHPDAKPLMSIVQSVNHVV